MPSLDHTPYAGFEPGFGISFGTFKRLFFGMDFGNIDGYFSQMAHLSPKQAIQDFREKEYIRQDGSFAIMVFIGILFAAFLLADIAALGFFGATAMAIVAGYASVATMGLAGVITQLAFDACFAIYLALDTFIVGFSQRLSSIELVKYKGDRNRNIIAQALGYFNEDNTWLYPLSFLVQFILNPVRWLIFAIEMVRLPLQWLNESGIFFFKPVEAVFDFVHTCLNVLTSVLIRFVLPILEMPYVVLSNVLAFLGSALGLTSKPAPEPGFMESSIASLFSVFGMSQEAMQNAIQHGGNEAALSSMPGMGQPANQDAQLERVRAAISAAISEVHPGGPHRVYRSQIPTHLLEEEQRLMQQMQQGGDNPEGIEPPTAQATARAHAQQAMQDAAMRFSGANSGDNPEYIEPPTAQATTWEQAQQAMQDAVMRFSGANSGGGFGPT